jgi:hypothetical protein
VARTKPTTTVGFQGEDDEWYTAVLLSAKKAKSKIEGYSEQIEVDWETKQGGKMRDWLAIFVGVKKNGQVAILRQLLNALAEKGKDEELWFDADTLEWGYDLDGDDTTPAFAVLTPGMALQFKGENVLKPTAADPKRHVYKITGYKVLKAKK